MDHNTTGHSYGTIIRAVLDWIFIFKWPSFHCAPTISEMKKTHILGTVVGEEKCELILARLYFKTPP